MCPSRAFHIDYPNPVPYSVNLRRGLVKVPCSCGKAKVWRRFEGRKIMHPIYS